METAAKKMITIEARVNAPVEKVWQFWAGPEHIKQWNTASDDWHTTKSENDLREGGTFSARMEAKDGSFGFDFEAIYDEVVDGEKFTYTMLDGRKASVEFKKDGDQTNIVVSFDAENENPEEMQKNGWQAILNNFKSYAERF